jgi:hypothetical protein
VSHSHLPPEYWTRRHAEAVVLDIGGDVGALVLYTSPALHGHEIEVAPLGSDAGDSADQAESPPTDVPGYTAFTSISQSEAHERRVPRRVHSAVLERTIGGRVVCVAVYPELRAGNYEVCCDSRPRFTITGGGVSEVHLTS